MKLNTNIQKYLKFEYQYVNLSRCLVVLMYVFSRMCTFFYMFFLGVLSSSCMCPHVCVTLHVVIRLESYRSSESTSRTLFLGSCACSLMDKNR